MGDIGKLMEDQFLSLLAYVAEQERKKNKQRQQEGITVAKASLNPFIQLPSDACATNNSGLFYLFYLKSFLTALEKFLTDFPILSTKFSSSGVKPKAVKTFSSAIALSAICIPSFL